MGTKNSKLSAQAQQEQQYASQMKNPAVVAAIETLEIDKPTTGLKFYRLFAAMDKDGSKSIDLEEFHQFFELPHTPFSDLVFSNLGKQTPIRGVPFDDFMLNLWNFCTMAPQDMYTHIFRLYDDDHNGTLDAAECESLFRLLYHTENLPSIVKNQLKSMTSNKDEVITLDAFLTMCSSKKTLFKPIFDLQTRARSKSLGESFWASVSKKRVKILNGHKDVFDAANSRLQVIQRQLSGSGAKTNISPDSLTRSTLNSSTKGKDGITSDAVEPRIPKLDAAKLQVPDTISLGAWVQGKSQKELQAYMEAFSQAYVAEYRWKEQSKKSSTDPDQDQRLLDLRYNVAVATKRRDEARNALEELWGQEQSSLIAKRQKEVATLVRSISTKTLHKQTGKKSSAKVVKSYTHKKLEIEVNTIRGRFSERWQALERAAELGAQRDLEASIKTTTKPTLHQKSINIVNEPSKSRVVPTSRK